MGQRTHVHLPRMLPGAGSRSPLTCLDQGAPWMPRPGFRKPRDKAARLRNAGPTIPTRRDFFQAATWNDSRPSFSFDSPSITPKNIEVLDAYLHRPPLLYKVEKLRTVLLSEQGFHTKDYSSEAQQLQAVALVYTWHKIRPLETIEAFHNHRWIDAREEGGLLLGLRTLGDAKTPYGERKFGLERLPGTEHPRGTGRQCVRQGTHRRDGFLPNSLPRSDTRPGRGALIQRRSADLRPAFPRSSRRSRGVRGRRKPLRTNG